MIRYRNMIIFTIAGVIFYLIGQPHSPLRLIGIIIGLLSVIMLLGTLLSKKSVWIDPYGVPGWATVYSLVGVAVLIDLIVPDPPLSDYWLVVLFSALREPIELMLLVSAVGVAFWKLWKTVQTHH